MDQKPNILPTPVLNDDSTGTITQLKSIIREFVFERQWEKYHSPKSLAMSIAIEAGELMEHFQWTDPSNPQEPLPVDSEVAQEMADVFAYLLRLSDLLGVDLSQALAKKMEHNRRKYPIGQPYTPKSI